ncbi:hypothetical protein ACP70R_027152 [Stipagrostis hirtigluma subsp. patula]
MATCDDDFGLLCDDDAHHPPPETQPKPSDPPPPPQLSFYLPQKPLVSSGFTDDGARHFSPAAGDGTPDRRSHQATTKRMGGAKEEPGDVDEYCSYFSGGGSQGSKKGRGGGGASSSGSDYRKEREEWSEGAICSLLDAYTERFEQLMRGNLRARDWLDVVAAVNRQHPARGSKSVDQCKNKIDNLRRRYKLECQRIAGSSSTSSNWPWFKKMDFIFGSRTSIASPKPAATTSDDKPMNHEQQKKSCTPSMAGLPSTGVGSKLTPLRKPRWKRVLLKIGGSVLAGAASENVDPKVIMLIAREVQVACLRGVQVAIVVGSRNIYCGDTWAAETGVDRAATYPISG